MAITYLHAGFWPNWQYYLEYIKAYSVGNFGTMPIYFWEPWVLIISVYFVSLLVFTFRSFGDKDSKIVFALTAMGIAQFTYYLGRSHPNNLFHICLPAIMLAFYWLDELSHQPALPKGLLLSAAFSFYFIMGEFLAVNAPSIITKTKTAAGYVLGRTIAEITQRKPLAIKEHLANLWYSKTTDSMIDDTMYLINKYAPNKPAVALFIYYDLNTETLIRLEKTNVFPIANPREDNIVKSSKTRVLTFPYRLQAGDIIFWERNFGRLLPVQMFAIERLSRDFNFQGVETRGGVVALRLLPKPAGNTRIQPEIENVLTQYSAVGILRIGYKSLAPLVLYYRYAPND